MKWATSAAAIEAAATSLLLIVSPALFAWLLLDAEITEPGQALGRLAGIVLLGFASAAWPAPAAKSVSRAMLSYNLLATIYLCYLGLTGRFVGILLWPAVAVHLLLAVLLATDRANSGRA